MAASRSPFLIASSTVRTAPRIWVRRDLLMMVRRAILRVAFLAEVVLAIAQNFLQRRPVAGMARLIDVDRRGRRGLGFQAFVKMPLAQQSRLCSEASKTADAAQRTAAAGLRPPPLRVLIEGPVYSVNGFPARAA